ncbi:MAG: DUF4390 domain-containing protein [Nitrospirae bacterium]|nr:DUF4390 domain-containing protein [Nitrospirota bacterium]
MIKELLVIILCIFFLALTQSYAGANLISGMDIKIQGSYIIVNTDFSDSKAIEASIKSGVEKEFTFHIELFRVWKFWPDDLIVTKKIQNTMRYDNLRGLFTAASYDGTKRKEKTFKNFNELKQWGLVLKDINLANTGGLEHGRYLVRITVESQSKKLPPLLGFFMLFIPEKEMSISKKSRYFVVGN